MFGIVYLTYSAIVGGLAKIGEAIRDSEFKKRTYDANTGLYQDSKGRTYDASMGGKQVRYDWNPNGRTYTKELLSGKVIRDITQEKINGEYERLKANPRPGVTVVRWNLVSEENHSYRTKDYLPEGAQYKDLKTGSIYVIRDYYKEGNVYRDLLRKTYLNAKQKEDLKDKLDKIPLSHFYLDIETGLLVRVVDNEYEKIEDNYRKQCKWTEEEIQKKVNKEVKERKRIDEQWIADYNREKQEKIDKGLKKYHLKEFYDNNNLGYEVTREAWTYE